MAKWQKGQSGNPAGRPRKKQENNFVIDAQTGHAVPIRRDGWEDLVTALGQVGYDKRTTTEFGIVTPTTLAVAMALWRGNDLARKIIEKPPKEEMRAGFVLTIQDDDTAKGDVNNAAERISKVYKHWKKLGVIPKIQKVRCFQRAYGAGAILLGANDGQTPDKPLKIESVRSFDWMTVLEGREIEPFRYYSDPNKDKFGQVELFKVRQTLRGPGASGDTHVESVSIHESRLIVFEGTTVSSSIVSGTTPGWPGDSCLTPIYEILRDYGIGWSGAAMLLADFSQAVYKMFGLADVLSADTTEQFTERMRAMERSRSIARCIIIDKDEEFERKTTSLQGLPELLSEFKTRVAAAADMPVTVLFGTSAKGLNATGEGDEGVWYDEVAGNRELYVIPALTRITELCLQVTGGLPENWEVHGKPLKQMTAKEEAEIAKIHAEADSIRIADRIVTPEEVAVSRYGGGTYGHELRIDFQARERGEEAGPKPIGLPPPEMAKSAAPSKKGVSPGKTSTSTRTKKSE